MKSSDVKACNNDSKLERQNVKVDDLSELNFGLNLPLKSSQFYFFTFVQTDGKHI